MDNKRTEENRNRYEGEIGGWVITERRRNILALIGKADNYTYPKRVLIVVNAITGLDITMEEFKEGKVSNSA